MPTVRNTSQQVTRDGNLSPGTSTLSLGENPFSTQISSFTGSAGDAIISKSAAYLVTDARYWHQAERELDLSLWAIVQAGSPDGPKDWIEWLMVSLLKGLRRSDLLKST